MTYKQATDALNKLINYEKKPGKYQEAVYDPQKTGRLLDEAKIDYTTMDFIHIAGTNGKGSTAFAASCITEALNKKVGLYTSPHIFRINERIRVNREEISNDDFADLLGQYIDFLRKNSATYFETMTFFAVAYFAQNKCDIAVLETGLGGRLDSTNFCKPRVSIITPISFDHSQLLGDTIAKIAAEKAGIIKANTPVVTAKQSDDAMMVLQETAKDKKAPLHIFDESVRYKIVSRSIDGMVFNSTVNGLDLQNIRLKQIGDVFVENFLLAVLALDRIFSLDNKTISKAAKLFHIDGRMQTLANNLIDVSHNQAGFEALFDTIKKYITARPLTLYIGVLIDKTTPQIAKTIRNNKKLFDKTIIFDFDTGTKLRMSGGKKLYGLLDDLPNMSYLKNISQADISKKGFNIFAGSFYSLREIFGMLD